MKLTLATVAALALILVACGASTDSGDDVVSLGTETTVVAGTDVTTAPDDTSDEDALIAFTECMRDNGLEMDDPTVDSEGNLQLGPPADFREPDFDIGAFQAAREECQSSLDGVTLGFQASDTTSLEDAVLEWASCMRDSGYDVDDPDFSAIFSGSDGDGGVGGPFADIDQDDPAFKTAMDVCEDLLPGLDGFGAGSGG